MYFVIYKTVLFVIRMVPVFYQRFAHKRVHEYLSNSNSLLSVVFVAQWEELYLQ